MAGASCPQADDESKPHLVAREQRIQRNQAVMIALNLGLPAAPSSRTFANRPLQQRTRSVASGPVRRSKRQLPAEAQEQAKGIDR